MLFKQRCVDCIVGRFTIFSPQVIKGQPEVNKIAALSKIRGLFPVNPFVAGFGNKVGLRNLR